MVNLGTGFDCASEKEIKTMLDYGVKSSSIIYANTIKSKNSLVYALKNGVTRMTFDNLSELVKIGQVLKDDPSLPRPKLIIRIAVHTDDHSTSTAPLEGKFGAELDHIDDLLIVS